MKLLQRLFIITRGWSFPMSITSVTIGTTLAARFCEASVGLYLLTLLGATAFHASANTFNDYFDLKNKIDTPDAPTARYRPHGVFERLITPCGLLWISIALLCVALLVAGTLAVLRSAWLWPLIAAGIALNIFYTALPKNSLKYIACGEPAVFLAFGPLLIEGSFVVQTQQLSKTVFFLSIPTGCFVALVLFANNLRDSAFDARQGIKTLATITSPWVRRKIFAILTFLPYALIVLYIMMGLLGWAGLLVFLSLRAAIKIIVLFSKQYPPNADQIASQAAMQFNTALILAIIADTLVQAS